MEKKSYSTPKANIFKSASSSANRVRKDIFISKTETVSKPKKFDNKYQATSYGFFVVFGLCVLLLVFAYIMRFSMNNQASVPLFTSLLSRLSTLSTVEFSFNLLGQIDGSWVVEFGLLGAVSFDWLRVAINAVLSALSIFYWLGQNLLFIFRFAFEIVRWLLVG